MDSTDQPGIMSYLVQGLRDKTVQMAEEKLRKVVGISDSPEEAVLGLVASAASSGASRLEVRIQSNDLVLTHDGQMLAPPEVTELARQSRNRELAQALRLCLASPENRVELEFLSSVGMHKIVYHAKGETAVTPADLGDLKLAKMTTRVVLKGTGNYRRVNQALGNELPEIALIRRRCFLAPLDLQLSGRALDRYAHLPESLVTGSNFHQEPSAAMPALPSLPGLGTVVHLHHLAPKLRQVKSGLCGVAKNGSDAGWYSLHHGVARPLSEVAWPSRTWGFVSVPPNPNLEALSQDISNLCASLVDELYREVSGHTASASVQEDTLAFLEQQRGTLLGLGHQPIEVDKTFLRLRQTVAPSSDPRVLNSRLELAASLETQGETEEAQRHYSEVLPVWESEALNHFDKYRFEEGASLWQKALLLHEKVGTDPEQVAGKYLRLAEIGREQRLGCAEPSYRRAILLYRSLPSPPQESLLKCYLGLAEVLKKNRVLTESLQYAEQAEKIQLEISGGQETKDLVPALKLQAEIHDLMGDYGRSTDLEQKALLLRFRR